jgi:hypothetical protein
MVITSRLPDINEPKTYLTASVAAAGTALTVANNAGFVANDYIVTGKPGQESAELHKISSVSGDTTINIVGDAMDLAASVETPVTFIKYNQVRFYLGDWSARYATGTVSINKDSKTLTGSGTTWTGLTTAYSLLLNGKWYDIASVDSATQITLVDAYADEDTEANTYALVSFAVAETVAIAITQEFTKWDDTDALKEDYYRTDYYNSTSTAYSSKSSIISAAEQVGFSEFTLRSLEDSVLEALRDKEANRYDRNVIDQHINDALRDLTNTIISSVKEDYLSTKGTIDFKSGRGEYPLFDDFRKLTAVWISYNGTDYNKAIPMKISDDLPDVNYDAYEPRYYIRDNVIGFRPEPTADVTAGAKVWYDRRVPSLKYEGDEIPAIFRDFKRSFVDYALDMMLSDDDQTTKAVKHNVAYGNSKGVMIETLKDRDSDATNSIEIVNDEDLYD